MRYRIAPKFTSPRTLPSYTKTHRRRRVNYSPILFTIYICKWRKITKLICIEPSTRFHL